MNVLMANAIAQLSGQTKEWKNALAEVTAYKTNIGKKSKIDNNFVTVD